MRFCIPILEDRGLLSPVSPHFDSAPMLLIVDGATLAYRSVPNPGGDHREPDVDAYIVSGIGERALAELGRTSARVYRADPGRVADALAEQIAGRLQVVREGTPAALARHAG